MVCFFTECVQSKIGQVLRQLPIFTLSRDVSTTNGEQSEDPGLNSKAEEEGKDLR